jgi:hypothetical protein
MTVFPLTVADAVRRVLPVVLAAVGGVVLLLVVLLPLALGDELPQAASVSARARARIIGEKRESKSFMNDILLVI